MVFTQQPCLHHVRAQSCLSVSFILPFEDLDDEQRCVVPIYYIYYPFSPRRISIAEDHPNDLDSGPSSLLFVAPS